MDNMVAITITFDANVEIRQSNGFGEVERTGRSEERTGMTHTVVAGSQIKEYAEAEALAGLKRAYGVINVTNIAREDVSMIYPSPRYRL